MHIKLDIAAGRLLTEEMRYKDLMERFNSQNDKMSRLEKELKVSKQEEKGVGDKYKSHIKGKLSKSLVLKTCLPPNSIERIFINYVFGVQIITSIYYARRGK